MVDRFQGDYITEFPDDDDEPMTLEQTIQETLAAHEVAAIGCEGARPIWRCKCGLAFNDENKGQRETILRQHLASELSKAVREAIPLNHDAIESLVRQLAALSIQSEPAHGCGCCDVNYPDHEPTCKHFAPAAPPSETPTPDYIDANLKSLIGQKCIWNDEQQRWDEPNEETRDNLTDWLRRIVNLTIGEREAAAVAAAYQKAADLVWKNFDVEYIGDAVSERDGLVAGILALAAPSPTTPREDK